MKCQCKNCRGTGTIDCPDCDGDGSLESTIEDAEISDQETNYDQLVQLKKDAKECRRKAKELGKLNPSKVGIYAEQLVQTLSKITAQAEELLDP